MTLELEASSAQIQRILQSKTFRTSEVHRNLLSYLADKSLAGDADGLKEYTVGLDVFAKPESYDPRQESTVRMHMARLRQKLGEYYRTEGVDDPILVDLPKGGFKVIFEQRAIVTEELPVPDPLPAPRSGWPWHETVLAVALVVAVACALYFGERLRQVQGSSFTTEADWTPDLRLLWEPLVTADRPLIVAMSTVSAAGGGPVTGAFRLGEFLGPRKSNVQVLTADQIEAPEVAMGNVVFVGPVAQNRQMQVMSSNRPFMLETDGIRNQAPVAGEPPLYKDLVPADPQDPEVSYALISRVPGLYGNGEVLYISGNRTASISGGVHAFTDPAFARTLVGKMARDGQMPAYYQIILKVQSMDGMPIDVVYVVHRELPAPPNAASGQ